jgi:hypothetical protein
MRTLKDLDIEKSIKSRKLIFEESWFDKSDSFISYLIFVALGIFSVMCLDQINPQSSNDRVGYYLFPIIISLCLYGFYCKFFEKNLREIKFSIHKEDAKQKILEYGKKYHYRISKISDNLIFLNEPTDDFGMKNTEKTILVFFKGDAILYTLIKEGSRLNFPVLFSQHLTRRDFKKILKK